MRPTASMVFEGLERRLKVLETSPRGVSVFFCGLVVGMVVMADVDTEKWANMLGFVGINGCLARKSSRIYPLMFVPIYVHLEDHPS